MDRDDHGEADRRGTYEERIARERVEGRLSPLHEALLEAGCELDLEGERRERGVTTVYFFPARRHRSG